MQLDSVVIKLVLLFYLTGFFIKVINIYQFIIKICILLSILLLNACVVSENPGPEYINPRYPAAAPYGYNPYQQPGAFSPPAAQPGSRYYTNPYEFPQPNYYQYYDSDRYYKPPNTYDSRSSADSR
jgi:hypothetical protein